MKNDFFSVEKVVGRIPNDIPEWKPKSKYNERSVMLWVMRVCYVIGFGGVAWYAGWQVAAFLFVCFIGYNAEQRLK